jgi:hypothetical protein
MALFSSKKSSTTNQTTNTFTDQSANAAQGAIAAGAGAEINITTTDKDIALGSVAAQRDTALGALVVNRDVSQAALGSNERVAGVSIAAQNALAQSSIEANRDINARSLDTTSRLAQSAINTVAGIGEVASRERQDVLASTNLALQSQQGLANKFSDLASAALERSQTPDSAVTKQLIYVVGAVLAVVVLFALHSRKTK